MMCSALALNGMVPEEAPAIVSAQVLGSRIGGDETILLVAEDSPSREVLRSALECVGYRVIAARNVSEALAHICSHVDVLIADFQPGESNALDLARTFRTRQPQVKVLLMTSYLYDFARQVRDGEDFAMLAKPFELGQFLHMIRLLCDNERGPALLTEIPSPMFRRELYA
jgi:DNA-binding NtrC family response regulator